MVSTHNLGLVGIHPSWERLQQLHVVDQLKPQTIWMVASLSLKHYKIYRASVFFTYFVQSTEWMDNSDDFTNQPLAKVLGEFPEGDHLSFNWKICLFKIWFFREQIGFCNFCQGPVAIFQFSNFCQGPVAFVTLYHHKRWTCRSAQKVPTTCPTAAANISEASVESLPNLPKTMSIGQVYLSVFFNHWHVNHLPKLNLKTINLYEGHFLKSMLQIFLDGQSGSKSALVLRITWTIKISLL